MAKIGYCCKTVVPDPKHGIRNIPEMNFKGTTATWLKTNPTKAEDKLLELTEWNCNALMNMVKYVGGLDESRRMVRIGSDVLPMYTHDQYIGFWSQGDARNMAGKILEQVGDYCRSRDIRLSMHPGQFTVIASDREDVVESSIREVEFHTDVARMMGYGTSWHDHGFKINIHISGRRGPDGFRQVLGRLSPEARNLLTVENEEMTYGLDSVLELSDTVPVVLDIHHHWVREGEYIRRTDDRVSRVIDSWRGVRPVLHYSVSREDILVDHDPDVLPDRDALINAGFNKMKLRAHSDRYWNRACNQWVAEFLTDFDIQCESKHKNLAVDDFMSSLT